MIRGERFCGWGQSDTQTWPAGLLNHAVDLFGVNDSAMTWTREATAAFIASLFVTRDMDSEVNLSFIHTIRVAVDSSVCSHHRCYKFSTKF